MFDIGFWEMAFIGVIALVIIGPERLPGVARSVGLWVGKGRRMLNDVKTDVKREMKEYDVEQVRALKNELESASKDLKDITSSNSDPLGIKDVSDELKGAVESTKESTKKVGKKAGNADQKTRKKTVKKKTVTSRKPAAKKVARKKSTKPAATTPVAKKQATRKSSAKKATTRKAPVRKTAQSGKTAKATSGKTV